MFSDSASNISSFCWSGSQFSVDESLVKATGHERRYRENVSPEAKTPSGGFQTDQLHPNSERGKSLRTFAAEEKRLKEQEAQQLERAKHKLLLRHPLIRAFDMEFKNQMLKKENKDLISLRGEMNRRKIRSEEEEHDEMLRTLAEMDRYKEQAALERRHLLQSVVINQKLTEEKRQTRKEMKKLGREEKEALLLKDEQDVLNYRGTTAKLKEKQKLSRGINPLTPLKAREEMERRRSYEEEEQRKRIQLETDMIQQKRKDDQERQGCKSQTQIPTARTALEQRALDKADKDGMEKKAGEMEKKAGEMEKKAGEMEKKAGEMEKKAEETRAYIKELQIEEKRPPKQDLYESGGLHEVEESQQLETEAHKARLYRDANYDLAMERREHTLKPIKTEEQLEEIKDYIRSKLTVARERGLDVEALLSLKVGNCGMFLSEERPDILGVFPPGRGGITRVVPLPHYGTDDTRRVKRIQALGGFTVTLPNQNPATLPPLRNCVSKIRVRDLLRDETHPSPISEMEGWKEH